MSKRIPLYARKRTTALLGTLAAFCAGLMLLFSTGGAAQAAPPTPPSAAEAKTELNALKVQTPGTLDGYSRDKFPHWIDQGNNCDTREVVLKRDGKDVKTGSDCYPTSGSWTSPYDGKTWTKASDLDIDHLVPLAEAWRSGARDWTQAKRQELANNLKISQLVAVTDNLNQSKSDKDPAQWMPPLKSYHCQYARMWIWVKHTYSMTIDSAEKKALETALGTC